MGGREVDWETLDKRKFFVYGTGLFSGVTVLLFPLSVIKTRQIASETAHGGRSLQGLGGAATIAREVWAREGARGLYKGFGTVIFGTIPARIIYLTTLEKVRVVARDGLRGVRGGGDDPFVAGASSFVAGFSASLVTQSVTVPIDVVSQRLMITDRVRESAGAGPSQGHVQAPRAGTRQAPRGGFQTARAIVRNEGIRGLYRGLPMSLVTYAPSTAAWWRAYSFYGKVLGGLVGGAGAGGAARPAPVVPGPGPGGAWGARASSPLDQEGAGPESPAAARDLGLAAGWRGAAVQAMAGVLAGVTSAVVTTPLDVVKTKMQVTETARGSAAPTVASTVRDLVAQDGLAALYRGVVPRMASSALWGTCMVSAYEYLKRTCRVEPG